MLSRTILVYLIVGFLALLAQETTKYWVDVEEKICLKNKGKIRHNGCRTSWDSAVKICVDQNATLPTLDDFKSIVIACDGRYISVYDKSLHHHVHKNIEDESYQECYQKKGFLPYQYWSQKKSKERVNEIWLMHFRNGDIYENYRGYNGYVRCISYTN